MFLCLQGYGFVTLVHQNSFILKVRITSTKNVKGPRSNNIVSLLLFYNPYLTWEPRSHVSNLIQRGNKLWSFECYCNNFGSLIGNSFCSIFHSENEKGEERMKETQTSSRQKLTNPTIDNYVKCENKMSWWVGSFDILLLGFIVSQHDVIRQHLWLNWFYSKSKHKKLHLGPVLFSRI